MNPPMYQYKLRILHDKGRVTITTYAQSEGQARANICKAEGCPESAIKACTLIPISPATLAALMEDRGTESHFFTRSAMRFFGDSMGNYGVRAGIVNTYTGETRDVWELYRRRPVKHGLQSSAYFDRSTFERVHPSPNA